MSYLEFFGVLTGTLSTWLVARNNVWTWPLGVVSAVLFFFLFYQIQLYPDMLLQVFFSLVFLQGWWRWTHPAPTEAVTLHTEQPNELRITRLTNRQWLTLIIGTLIATVVLGTFARHLHALFPLVFSRPSAFPYLDSFTSVMSVVGTFMMVHKKLECWWVWLLIDLISTYMYFMKGVKLVGAEYAIFCLLAVQGFLHWSKAYKHQSSAVPV